VDSLRLIHPTAEARRYLTDALEIFERLGTLLEPDKVRKELAELPQYSRDVARSGAAPRRGNLRAAEWADTSGGLEAAESPTAISRYWAN